MMQLFRYLILVVLAPCAMCGAESTTIPTQPSLDGGVASPAPVAVAHATRRLEEDELVEMVKAALATYSLPEVGEWEVKLARPWPAVTVPDEALKLEITQPAPGRVTATGILAFEIRAGHRVVGSWQMPLQARLYREVLVARSNLQRGAPLSDTVFASERRDVLGLRGVLSELPPNAANCEIGESIQAGAPLLTRAVRPRRVVLRGQTVNAVMSSGALVIALKVEALEEGIPGQLIRVRNPESRRELRGKIQDEHTIEIPL